MFDKKIVMCGCHEAGWYLIKDLLEAGLKFDNFVILTPEQGKQYQISGYRDFSDLAQMYDIPIYIPEKYSLKSEQDLAFLQEHQFALLIQGGWQRLFPETILQTLKIGAVGGHGSADCLLKGRGRSPIVTKRMLLRSVPQLLDGAIQLRPQVGTPSHYPKRTPEDGLIDWENMDVWEIYNFVRGQTRPYPGAFAPIGDKTYQIWRVQVFDTRISYPNCREGVLLIEDYEPIS